MGEVILFPDVELALIEGLESDLPSPWTSTQVVTQVPPTRPATFVLVRRNGGPASDLIIDQATVTVESWSTGQGEAHDLARMVRGLLGSWSNRSTTVGLIYGAREASGPQWFPDPDSRVPRYVQTFVVATRGVPA